MNLIYSRSEQSFHIKPTKPQFAKLTFHHCKTSIDELIESIEQGFPFTCQLYNGKRVSQNFIAQNIFALDFDETLKLSEIEDICSDYGLSFNFGYPTYHHNENKPRYRILFICDGEIQQAKLVRDIYEAFTIIFNGKNDKACLDLARIWAGTDKKVFFGRLEYRFKPANILKIANELKYARAGNRKRKSFDNNLIEKSGDTGKTILYSYNKTEIPLPDEANSQQKLIDNWKLDDLLQCRLFKTFYEGCGTPSFENKLTDVELMCMASNLMTIEGGEKLYKACLDRNGKYSKEKYSKISYLRNQRHYNTYLIGKYSPYLEDQLNQFQTFPEMLRKKGRVEVDLNNQPRIYTLEEAEQEMNKAFEKADSDTRNTVYLFKIAPGLGKSQHYKNVKGIAMGFPNNNLKNEQYTSSDLPADEKLVTPEALTKFSKPVQAYLRALYQKGLNKNAFFKIIDLANMHPIFEDNRIDYDDVTHAKEYLSQNMLINDASIEKTVFTTHTRLVHQGLKHDTYVFDENAFNSIFELHKTSRAELASIKSQLWLRGFPTDELDAVLAVNDVGMHLTPNFQNYEDWVKEIIGAKTFNTNVLKFFQSSRFMFDGEFIHYEVNYLSKLPSDKKLIFLDATASISLFQKIFGERLVVFDISNVKFRGSIIQDTSKSCSKTGLEKYHKKISEKVGNLPVITHNDFKKYFANAVDTLHFGNLTGSNKLSGQNYCVVGTMTYHPSYYRFLADMLNIQCDDFKMKHMKVTYEGRKFWFTTFENPELQRLHLEQVEGELIQGVHRGRLLRTDAIVNLYSNFPLLQAKYIY